MRISDWSSDVCSSDLPALSSGRTPAGRTWPRLQPHRLQDREGSGVAGTARADERMRMGESSMRKVLFAAMAVAGLCLARSEERRVGKECVIRVDFGGRRIIKKK